MTMKVAIYGRGRVGRGLRNGLRGSDLSVTLRRGTDARFVVADLYVLAVPVHALSALAERVTSGLARAERRGALVHCAGFVGREVFAPDLGQSTGVMHPLVSFAERPPSLAGTSFFVAGEAHAVTLATRVVRAVGARAVRADVHGAAYHGVAAMIANGAAGLSQLGAEELTRLGVPRREAERALSALLRSVADNIESVGLPDALSGPILRGDADTVRRHRAALSGATLRAYDGVAPAILASARTLSRAQRRAIKNALSEEP